MNSLNLIGVRNRNERGTKSIDAAVKARGRVVAGPPEQFLHVFKAVRADPLPNGINAFHKLEGHAHISRASDGAGGVQGGERGKADGDRHGPARAPVCCPLDGFQRFTCFFIRRLVACCAVVVARSLLRRVTGTSDGCGGCGGCSQKGPKGCAQPVVFHPSKRLDL